MFNEDGLVRSRAHAAGKETSCLTPAQWQELGIRASPTLGQDGRCVSINLDACSDGTATYKVEIYDKGVFKTHFFLGVFSHPSLDVWRHVPAAQVVGASALQLCRLATLWTPWRILGTTWTCWSAQ